MTELQRLKSLRIALVAIGLVFIFGIYPLTQVWPAGWCWNVGRSMYLEMILGIYATLGVFLLLAARDPQFHRSLIAFAAWSSVVHGAIMAAQALGNPIYLGHLMGDVPALLIVAAVLFWLTPRAARDDSHAMSLERAS